MISATKALAARVVSAVHGATGLLGGGSTPLYLMPCVAIVGGPWRSPAGLLSR